LTLEQHDDLLRAAVTLAGGSVFNHAGDRSVGCRRPEPVKWPLPATFGRDGHEARGREHLI